MKNQKLEQLVDALDTLGFELLSLDQVDWTKEPKLGGRYIKIIIAPVSVTETGQTSGTSQIYGFPKG